MQSLMLNDKHEWILPPTMGWPCISTATTWFIHISRCLLPAGISLSFSRRNGHCRRSVSAATECLPLYNRATYFLNVGAGYADMAGFAVPVEADLSALARLNAP